jgi:Protein of unknown function (DUF3108)
MASSTRLHTICIVCIVLCLFVHPERLLASPTKVALPSNLYYRISWNGLSLGRIRVSAGETDTHYQLMVDAKSRGVASLFSPFHTVIETQGIVRKDGSVRRYIPQNFLITSQKNDKNPPDSTHITYDDNGHIRERMLNPPNNDPAWRPIVPIEKASTGTDPLTCILTLRQQLLDSSPPPHTLISYDGNRLATLIATPLSQTVKEQIALRIERKPIDGYTPKEWKKYRAGDPPITVWFSAKHTMMPERIELALPLGIIRADQVEEK